MSHLGTHIILELYGGNSSTLADPQQVESIIREAANRAGATIIESWSHHFHPLGVSAVLIISESHITIHSWPEHGYAAVDIFSCGDINSQAGIDYLIEAFEAKEQEVKVMQRGALVKFKDSKN